MQALKALITVIGYWILFTGIGFIIYLGLSVVGSYL